jgi:hypothetical protein
MPPELSVFRCGKEAFWCLGRRLGNLLAQDILAGWPSMRPLAHSLLQVPHEQFDAVIGQLATEWEMYRTSYEIYFACGQV